MILQSKSRQQQQRTSASYNNIINNRLANIDSSNIDRPKFLQLVSSEKLEATRSRADFSIRDKGAQILCHTTLDEEEKTLLEN